MQILNRIIAPFALFPARVLHAGRTFAPVFRAHAINLVAQLRALPWGVRLRLIAITTILVVMTGGGFASSFRLADHDALSRMSDKDRLRYGRTLATRLGNDPATFLNLAANEVRLLFSEPGLERREGPITVWQYRSNNCVLDVYLEAPPGRETQRVVDFEVRDRTRTAQSASKSEAQQCLQSIMRDNALRPQNRVIVANLTG